MKKKIVLFIIALFTSVSYVSAQQLDTLTMRIKGMKCAECGHKVYTRIVDRIPDGIEDMWFDYEKRIASVAYDPQKTNAEQIKAQIAGTRYNPTSYSKNDIIIRGMGLRMNELNTEADAKKAVAALQGKVGIDSLAPHIDRHYLFIRYDANKTSKAEIRSLLNAQNFTPTNYYSSPTVEYGYFHKPGIKDDEATREKIMTIDGVEDFNINTTSEVVAITYFNDTLSADKLKQEMK